MSKFFYCVQSFLCRPQRRRLRCENLSWKNTGRHLQALVSASHGGLQPQEPAAPSLTWNARIHDLLFLVLCSFFSSISHYYFLSIFCIRVHLRLVYLKLSAGYHFKLLCYTFLAGLMQRRRSGIIPCSA